MVYENNMAFVRLSAGLPLWTRPAGNIDRLLHGWHSAAAAVCGE